MTADSSLVSIEVKGGDYESYDVEEGISDICVSSVHTSDH